jgi:hypothetical protein
MLKTIRKCTVTKKALNFTPRFRRQAQLCRQKQGMIENFEYVREFGKIFENVGFTVICVY